MNFLDSQLQACENSSFCNTELVGDTLEGFRSFVVRSMVLMSRVSYEIIKRISANNIEMNPLNSHYDSPYTIRYPSIFALFVADLSR